MSGHKQHQTGAAKTAAPATGADPHAHIRQVLRHHGLKQAWQDEAGNVHFDAAYAATLPTDSLTLITAE